MPSKRRAWTRAWISFRLKGTTLPLNGEKNHKNKQSHVSRILSLFSQVLCLLLLFVVFEERKREREREARTLYSNLKGGSRYLGLNFIHSYLTRLSQHLRNLRRLTSHRRPKDSSLAGIHICTHYYAMEHYKAAVFLEHVRLGKSNIHQEPYAHHVLTRGTHLAPNAVPNLCSPPLGDSSFLLHLLIPLPLLHTPTPTSERRMTNNLSR